MHPASPAAPRSRASFALAGLVIVVVACSACGACGARPAPSGTTTGTSASGTGGAGGSADVESPCFAFCATEAAVGCPNNNEAACITACEGGKTTVSWCEEVVADTTACLSLEPPASFTCDVFGNVVAKPGVCAAELTAVQTCWYKGPREGLPDLRRACTDACGKQAALPCADPRCAVNCAGALNPGLKCNGAFAALLVCASRQDASRFFCGPQSPLPSLPIGVCAFEQGLLQTCLQRP